jgi:transcription elongation factor Elf1
MTTEATCPECAPTNVVFSKKQGLNVCADCGQEFAAEKLSTPLRIFLSYGHDNNEELVRRSKGDLEKRGHDGWFDKTPEEGKGIKAGDDWRRSITDGILRSDRVLSFQLATRMPDYRKLLLTLPEIAELDRKDAAELFDYLPANPLRSVINGGRERYLIVIDALDEAGEAGRNPLVEMLARNAQRLHDWLGLVVTSRPEFDVKTPLQALNLFPLDTQCESNRADIRDKEWDRKRTRLAADLGMN